ncbi:hypothetical protein FEK47_23270 [Escherichia sp. E3659]|uniref:hypothetical protein n=1 Tax=Escherichia sp. E3659 TaxID=2044462 RepID=UPI0010812B62|nr:hypothetical protein [Escherichia sp. E3659]TGB85800.1 hypothetical protein CRI65_10390 [Escherichia sp. E3659]TLJ03358.1 hypothetical protein FEK47_23270 [Escherichia sp. E3659]
MLKYLYLMLFFSFSSCADVYFYPFDRQPYRERDFYNIKYMCSEKWSVDDFDITFFNSLIHKGVVVDKFDSNAVRVLIEIYDKNVYIDSGGIASVDLNSGIKVDINELIIYKDYIKTKALPCREWGDF